MKIQLIVIYISLLSFTIHGQISSSNISPEKLAEIEGVVATHMQTFDTPALSVALVKCGQSTFINQGNYDRHTDRKVNENSIYQIASLSKTFTAIIINNLIHEGTLKPDEPITTYLPSDYTAKTKQKLSVITIRNLFHHQSGMRGDSKVLLKIRKGNGDFEYNYTAADFDSELMKTKLKLRPGEKYMYSNFGYALLGYVAELVTGKSYETLLAQYVSIPMKMTSTSAMIKDHNRLVTAYRKDKKNKVIKPWVMGKLTPPSGLFTTTSDLAEMLIQHIDVYRNKIKSPLILTDDTLSLIHI